MSAAERLQLCRHAMHVDDCRECLPDGTTVDEFVAAHPDGAELPDIALAMGVSKQAVDQAARRAMARLGGALGVIDSPPPTKAIGQRRARLGLCPCCGEAPEGGYRTCARQRERVRAAKLRTRVGK